MKHKKTYIITGIICLLILSLILISAFTINSHIIKVREETLESEKIDKNLDGLIVAYFSDLNYGNNLTDKDIEKIKTNINKFNPDLIIFGGDLISSKCKDTNCLIDFLSSLKASIGKYAVLGEQDLNDDALLDIYQQSDFNLINDNDVIFYNYSYINLVSINPSLDIDITANLNNINSNYYTITISHYPDLAKQLKDTGVDYILSGHSLGGQVYVPLINLIYRPLGAKTYLRGKHQIGNATLDISNGLGTIDKDVRLFANPEIVIYKLKG